jgi:hypothetical protein
LLVFLPTQGIQSEVRNLSKSIFFASSIEFIKFVKDFSQNHSKAKISSFLFFKSKILASEFISQSSKKSSTCFSPSQSIFKPCFQTAKMIFSTC